MKKLVFGLIAIVLLSINAHSQKVGIINKDGKPEITEDLSFLKEKWAAILKENKLEGEVERFEITKEQYVDDEKEATDGYYQITGYSKDSKLKVASTLTLEENSLSADFSSTATCSGCVYGCHPKNWRNGTWYCDVPCNECSKSETAN